MKRVSLVAIALLVSTGAVSCRKTHEPPPEVVSETVHCAVHEDGGIVTVDCLSPLREILAKEPDLRIMGISPFYRDDGAAKDIDARLFLWLSKSDRWPRAGDLEVSSNPCLPKDGVPDCIGVIQALVSAPSNHHYFLVPIYGRGSDEPHSGTWAILDVTPRPGHPAAGAWARATAVYVPCRLDHGSYFLDSAHLGVMKAKRDRLVEEPAGEDGARECESALAYYLRAHPTTQIIGMAALDSAPLPDVHPVAATPGTQGLMVLTTSGSEWPKADSLAIERGSCVGACLNPDQLIHDREALPGLGNAIGAVSLAEWAFTKEGRYVDELLWLLPAPQ